jgi:hypothetical protein
LSKYNGIFHSSPRPKIPPYLRTTDYYQHEKYDDNYPEHGIIFFPSSSLMVFLLLNVWQMDWKTINSSARQEQSGQGNPANTPHIGFNRRADSGYCS